LREDPFDVMARSIYNDARELAVRYARVPGVHILVRTERCTGCRKCVKEGFCRFGAISVVERKAVVNDRRCRGCVRCTHLCPQNALTIEVRPPQAVNETLRKLDKEIGRHL
jgi:heterodisulfide reductase subunit A-like polyferredoxin